MILTKENILVEIGFEPALDVFQVNPHSVDLRLAESATILPLATVSFKSMEKVTLPGDVMGVVYPRSSTNRRGLSVHMTGVVDANYSGSLTIPVTNHTSEPVTLLAGERVASIVFQRLEKQATLRLSKYHGTDGSYVPDKSEEMDMLQTGMVEALKVKFRFNQSL